MKPGLTITKAESDRLFAVAVEKYVDPVRKASRSDQAWPQEFFDACVSLCFNIGPAGFAGSSVVRRANAGDMADAIKAFLMWNKPAAIIARRQTERDQAATPYSRALPRARRGDKSPVRVPAGAAAPSPQDAGSPGADDRRAELHPSDPFPARPFRRAFFCARPGAAPGFWARLHALLSRPKAA